MKTRFHRPAATLIILTVVFFGATYASAKDSKTEKKIVVTINGTTISQAEIDAAIEQQLEQTKTSMQKQAVDFFIEKTVLLQECDKNKITVTPEDVDKSLEELAKTFPEGKTIDDALKASGMTKKDYAFSLRVRKLLEANVKETPPPTDTQIKEFYEQNKKSFEIPESVQSGKPAGNRSFDEVKDQIKTHLERNNKNEAIRAYIDGLKSKATIVYPKK